MIFGIKANIILLVNILLWIFTISCSDDKVNNPSEKPPEIPPIASFKIDFDEFPISSHLLKYNGHNSFNEITAKENWIWASFNVLFWQTFVSAGMIVPVASFTASFNNEPDKQDDGRWLWNYEFTPYMGIKYTASLFADLDGKTVYWEMYISKENSFDNFLWYFGESDHLATKGTWTINKEPEEPTPWVGIEWEGNLEESSGNIKYTNIVPGSEENGGYIFFGITSDDDYDAFYEIFKKGQNNTISIKWNKILYNGRVKDLAHFEDEEWHCWDTDLENAECN